MFTAITSWNILPTATALYVFIRLEICCIRGWWRLIESAFSTTSTSKRSGSPIISMSKLLPAGLLMFSLTNSSESSRISRI